MAKYTVKPEGDKFYIGFQGAAGLWIPVNWYETEAEAITRITSINTREV